MDRPRSDSVDGGEGERRVVTVVFCDVTGSTSLAERLDPEDWAEIMNAVFERIIEPVYRYGGTVTRLMGDSILAMFGAPEAHEDDPERAILAALGMIGNIESLRQELADRGLDFAIRVGVNTGLVVVGQVGSALRTEYTAMGDAVNVAARMEQTAEPGTVRIGAATHRLVEGLFEVDDLGLVEAKGKAEPVHAYRVIRSVPGGLSRRSASRLGSTFVGRQTEMTGLTDALERLMRGAGSVVTIIGEPGLGKTRLLEELRVRWSKRPSNGGHWFDGRGVSYLGEEAWLLVRQWLSALGADKPDQVATALTGIEETHRVALEAVLGSPTELEGEPLQRRIHLAMAEVLTRLASSGPLVIAVEDAHWLDSASLGFLRELLELAERQPILAVICLRPDRRSGIWQVKQTAEADYPHLYREYVLQPLTIAESSQLVTSILNIVDLPDDAHRRIIERTEGNPFFVEEVVTSLLEEGFLEEMPGGSWRVANDIAGFAVPESLQSLLLARVDRLNEQTRRVIQVASVIGRSFQERVLALMAERSENLEQELLSLQRAELIRQVARQPEPEYAFRHALTQEAAYASILLRRRRRYHLQLAETFVGLAESGVDVAPAVIARHFDEAGDSRAFEYALAAGEEAFRLYANAEAELQFARALRWAGDDPRAAAAYVKRGRALEILGRFEEALAGYRTLAEIGMERSDPRMILDGTLAAAGVTSWANTAGDLESAARDATIAIDLASQLADPSAEIRALRILALVAIGSNRPNDAVGYALRAVEIARIRGFTEELAHTLGDLTWVYTTIPMLDEAIQVNAEAESLWRTLDNRPLLADTLSSQSYVHWMLGDLDRAERVAAAVVELSLPIGNRWGLAMAGMPRGCVRIERGEYHEAMAILEEALRHGQAVGNVSSQIAAACELAWTLGLLGRQVEAADWLEATVSLAQSGLPGWVAWPRSVAARLALHAGDGESARFALAGLDVDDIAPGFPVPKVALLMAETQTSIVLGTPKEAMAQSDRLVKFHTDGGIGFRLADALLSQAAARLATGRDADALASIEQAKEVAEAQRATDVLWRVHTMLAELVTDPEERRASLRVAAAHLDAILAGLTDLEAEAYKSRPEAARLLAAINRI
jgi:class 3 adenylate cyclase/tetratricopeptide (TPR) repeat protein